MSRMSMLLLAIGILLLRSPSTRADQLIGSMSGVAVTPPPVQTSDVFFSPTPQFSIWISDPNETAPCIFGHDFADSVPCEEHHVVASCLVNGVGVPYAWHAEGWTWGSGWCHEVYSWRGVVVDLGAPGYFIIDRLANNSLGTGVGKVGISPWQIWTVGEVPPPFEILSAIFDDDVYQNGVDTAHLMVVTKSNWHEGSVDLTAEVTSNLGDQFVVGTDNISMTPEGEYVTQLA